MSRIHIGTMGWSYKFWTGSLYPKGVEAESYLTEYSKHFDTVEVDSTFYRIPSESTIFRWKEQTPPGFLFSMKFPRTITHQKMLRNSKEETERFIERVSGLRDKLGPLLLQFPKTLTIKHIGLLEDFLVDLPEGHRFAVEVRNTSLLNEEFYSLLRENGAALALLDRPSMPAIEMVTADFTYVRWEGDRKKIRGTLGRTEVDRTNEIEAWAEKIHRFPENAEVFGYFSKYYSGYPPIDAKQLLKTLAS
jgi:uncharacterized protein YecE (DUF72 family)